MNVNVFVLALLVSSSTSVDASLVSYDRINVDCTTPNNETAKCILLIDCSVLLNELENGTEEAKKFVTQSQCGWYDGPLVCCGTTGKGMADVRIRSDLSDSDLEYSQLFSDPSTCGIESEGPRIIGGSVTELYEFPWVVALEYYSKYNKASVGIGCGGSLINKNYVLTAAHCILDFDLVLIGVWLGDWNITSHPRDCRVENATGAKECNDEVLKIGVKDKIIHPFFIRNPFKNDIALVRLEQEVQYTDYIRPICLPAANQQLPPFGTLLTVAGWGATKSETWSTASDVKQKVELPLVRNDQCATKNISITENDFCAGGETGKDSCWGDSGGPIMRHSHQRIWPQWYLEGIVSHGRGCGIVEYPAVYVHLSKYMHWIKNVLKYNKKFAPCTTPNNETAYCIPFSMCTVISDGVKKEVPSAIEFANKSHCGSILIPEPHVCCGSTGKDVADFGVQFNFVPDSDNSLYPNFTTCGMERENPKIIGGSVTELYEFPWVVALEYKWIRDTSKLGIRCGGSLINKNYVLTSAMCVTNNYIEVISVWLGDWNITSHPRDCRTEDTTGVTECNDEVLKIGVKDKIPHPFFIRRPFRNNIALLRLEQEVQYTEYIRPICLPSANQPPPSFDTLLTVAGWGITENGKVHDIKLKVQVPLVSNDKCASTHVPITENDLCAGGEGGKDTCSGDSGGPIMSYSNRRNQPQWYLEGVVSHGRSCGRHPSVYTHVSKYMNWIENVMKYHEEFATCITPDNERAYCIPIAECKTINDGVTKGVLSVEFAIKSHCGSTNSEAYVCCGSAGETTKVALPSPIPKT